MAEVAIRIHIAAAAVHGVFVVPGEYRSLGRRIVRESPVAIHASIIVALKRESGIAGHKKAKEHHAGKQGPWRVYDPVLNVQ